MAAFDLSCIWHSFWVEVESWLIFTQFSLLKIIPVMKIVHEIFSCEFWRNCCYKLQFQIQFVGMTLCDMWRLTITCWFFSHILKFFPDAFPEKLKLNFSPAELKVESRNSELWIWIWDHTDYSHILIFCNHETRVVSPFSFSKCQESERERKRRCWCWFWCGLWMCKQKQVFALGNKNKPETIASCLSPSTFKIQYSQSVKCKANNKETVLFISCFWVSILLLICVCL